MLVDLTTAKEWLQVTDDDQDLVIQELIDQASAMVVDFIKRPDHGWDEHTVPRHVRAALYHILRRLFDDRAGELPGGPMPDFVKDMLWRERDPAIA